MLGHKLYQELGRTHDVFGSVRTDFAAVERFGIFEKSRIFEHIDATDRNSVSAVIDQARPDCVINAVGVIKQIPTARDPEAMVALNSVFPRELARMAADTGIRLVSISTDCVYDGSRGNYSEADEPDARDLYGMSKLLGEVDGTNCLTIRTSMIGRELGTSHSIVEWFLAHRGGDVPGFRKAIYSGFSTMEVARIIESIVTDFPGLNGVYNVGSDPISKFELLTLLNEAFAANVRIEPSDELAIDRSLNSSRFRTVTGYVPPAWPEMVAEMAADPTPYDTF
jgi:dTDP-4-dehydrorhamnose reductase